MSLYTDLIDAGIECGSHCSDLYFPATAETVAILKRHSGVHATRFRHNVHGTTWYEVVFGFDPYWQKVDAMTAKLATRANAQADARFLALIQPAGE